MNQSVSFSVKNKPEYVIGNKLLQLKGDRCVYDTIREDYQNWVSEGCADEQRCEAINRIIAFLSSTNCNDDCLDLSGLNLSSVPPDLFKYLNDVKKIDLSHNKLENIEDDVFSGLTVTDINLSHNQLKEINEKTFLGCSSLTSLNVRYNYLSSIHTIRVYK
jgi:hypothetical protein